MASGKQNTNSQFLLAAQFQAVFTAIANMMQNAGSPITNLYVSLHTGTLSASSAQNTSEAAYGSYARVAVARTTGGWSLSSQTISNVAAITFPACTSGSETETYVGIGTASSGAGQLLYFGALTSSLAVSSGITPQFAIGALTVTEA